MLDDSDDELFASKTCRNAHDFTPCASLDTKSSLDSLNLSPGKQAYGAESAKGRGARLEGPMNGMGESSMFSLFAPVEDDLTSDQAKTQTAPKLNAQTLFAFGVSSGFGTI